MQFPFFDLHCDTPTALWRCKQRLEQNDLAVSLQKAAGFDRWTQIMAIWTEHSLDDRSGWQRFFDVLSYLRADPAIQSGKARIVTNRIGDGTSLFLSVEDARILEGKMQRVYELYQQGVRIITPLWSGETCIGGSHDVKGGLTAFGKEALTEALKLGIVLDVSHASLASADQIFELSAKHGRPVMASHSNVFRLCPVSRNLSDQQIRDILALDGVIGLNLYCGFLSVGEKPSRWDVLRHIEYFLEQGCENALCFGCDMDGADLPEDLRDLSAIPSLREFLADYYDEKILDQLFFQNAYHFAERAFGSSAENL